jgi:hypothetical protein
LFNLDTNQPLSNLTDETTFLTDCHSARSEAESQNPRRTHMDSASCDYAQDDTRTAVRNKSGGQGKALVGIGEAGENLEQDSILTQTPDCPFPE